MNHEHSLMEPTERMCQRLPPTEPSDFLLALSKNELDEIQ